MRQETNMKQVANTSVVMFDTLAYVRHLRNAGISDKESEAHAEALTDAFRGAIVTKDVLQGELLICRDELKAEIQELRTELKAEIQELRTEFKAEIQELRTELKAEIQELRTEFKAEIQELRTELKAEIQEFRTELYKNGVIALFAMSTFIITTLGGLMLYLN